MPERGRSCNSHLLDLGVKPHATAERVECFGKRRHRLAVTGVERLDLQKRHVVDITSIGRGPADVTVVDQDGDAVGRGPDVELHPVRSVRYGQSEGGKGVLRFGD